MEGRGNGTEGMDGWVMGRRGWKVENGEEGLGRFGKKEKFVRRSLGKRRRGWMVRENGRGKLMVVEW